MQCGWERQRAELRERPRGANMLHRAIIISTLAAALAATLETTLDQGGSDEHPADNNSTTQASSASSACSCGMSYADAHRVARGAWDTLLAVLGNQVELLPFEDTILQRLQHASPRRTLRPLQLLEGTEVSGIRSGDITLHAVQDNNTAVHFTVRLKPLKIRGALRSGEETHLLRCYLVDTAFRFRTLADSGDTVYALSRAGHVTSVQVANVDRTETAFGQEVEALLAGAAVTSIAHELQRAAHVFPNWAKERAKQLEWADAQVPRSWSDYGRVKTVV